MKNMYVAAILVLSFLSVMANHNEAALVIRSADHDYISVDIDNQRDPVYGPVRSFDHLPPGSHFVRIFQVIRRHPGDSHPSRYVLYQGRINLRPGFITTFEVDCGRLRRLHEQPIPFFNPYPPCQVHPYGQCPSNCSGNNGHHGNPHNSYGQGNYYPSNPPGYGYYDEYDDYNHPGRSWSGVMEAQAFDRFMKELDRMAFDTDKKIYIETAVVGKSVTTRQVSDILGAIHFESNRLEVAKMLYAHTQDRENYYTLMNAFTFSSNKRALSDFILEQANR